METRSNHILVGGVMLALVAALAAGIIWLAGFGSGLHKEYDIFFTQSVEGLAKGGIVTYSGVPSGEVKSIELWRANPGFVRVRIEVRPDTPVLEGTTASIQGSFTGPSSILLDGATKGAPPLTDPGPAGVPEIPTKRTGLGALLNSAPQLMERLSTLSDQLSQLLDEKNQKSFGHILANTERLTSALADSGPDLRATVAETRVTMQRASVAIESVGKLAESSNALVNEDGRPMMADLRKAAQQAQNSMANLDAAITEAKPGLHALSTQTLPEVSLLVRDLRVMAESLSAVAGKIDRGGAGALIGGGTLPDYKPGRSGK